MLFAYSAAKMSSACTAGTCEHAGRSAPAGGRARFLAAPSLQLHALGAPRSLPACRQVRPVISLQELLAALQPRPTGAARGSSHTLQSQSAWLVSMTSLRTRLQISLRAAAHICAVDGTDTHCVTSRDASWHASDGRTHPAAAAEARSALTVMPSRSACWQAHTAAQ